MQSKNVHQLPSSKWFTFHRKSSHRMDELEDGSVGFIFTSPPYWNKQTYDDEASVLGSEKSPKE